MEPQTRLGNALLTKFAYDGIDLAAFREELAELCRHETTRAGALMDLSAIEKLQGHRDVGLERQTEALATCRAFRTHNGPDPKQTLLVYAAPIHMGGNTPVEFLLHGDEFNIITYYLPSDASRRETFEVPPHDVAFCAAPADSEDAEAIFDCVRALSDASNVPVLNLPAALIKPERDRLPTLFGSVGGLRLPKTASVDRAILLAAMRDGSEAHFLDAIGGYPYVVRPTGSHAGLGLEKIVTSEDFCTYLETRDEPTFFVSEFIDYASGHDGRFRKFRVILINGEAFPCHMAISDQWDVWYMNADMSASEAKRQEEAAFMNGFAYEFGKRHGKAFKALSKGLDLDYFGIDCAEDAQGNLVVFEADNALIVHDMDCEVTFPYKKVHMQRIFAAFERMLLARCEGITALDASRKLQLRAEVRHRAA